MNDVGRKHVCFVGVTRGARVLAKVVTKPEGVAKGPIHFHATIVAKITLLNHRFFEVTEIQTILVKTRVVKHDKQYTHYNYSKIVFSSALRSRDRCVKLTPWN